MIAPWALFGFAFTGLGAARVQHARYERWMPPTNPARAQVCPDNGLLAYYPLDTIGPQGSPDQSGLHDDAKVAISSWSKINPFIGAPTLVDGKVGQGLEFTGLQWLKLGNSSCSSGEKISVAAWIYQEDEKYPVPTVAAKSSWPSTGWWLCTTTEKNPADNRYVDMGIAWGTGFTHVKSGFQLPLREWHHVVVTLDNTQHEAQFFIDGKARPKQSGVHAWIPNWDHDVYVGDYDGSGRWPWRGRLDDVRIYSRVIDEAEVAAIYGGKPSASL